MILQDFAYATTDRNRMIGSGGHNATIKWIKETLEQFPDYYTVDLQPFPVNKGVSANLTINDASIEVYAVGFSPNGHASGPLAAVSNLGCEKVSYMFCIL